MAEQNLLFKIIDAIFNDREFLESLTENAARQNIYMVHSRMAIKYPDKVEAFNLAHINAKEELLWWN